MHRAMKRARSSLPSDATVDVAGGDLLAAYSAMARMWREETFVDCQVQVEGRTFKAHRLVLCAASDYMKSCFDGGLAESESASVTLKDMSSSTFEALLTWCYEGHSHIDEALLPELLAAASRLQVAPLQDAAEGMIIARLTPENCADAWVLGDRLELVRLADAARALALAAFVEVSSSDGFLGLPVKALESLMASDELVTSGEECVFEALKRWLNAQLAGSPTAEEVAGLLAQVRWPLLKLYLI